MVMVSNDGPETSLIEMQETNQLIDLATLINKITHRHNERIIQPPDEVVIPNGESSRQ